ncbi:MAG: tRNA pseudouridine(38-40) synthase TruA [Clostridia bacterium]|nr:tRNA pseudouridine(38-40) synthase TruA [Clostridia bacterium]MBQ4603264.1 tRNA pseudouridine(38-40) synthase TruA [Clostridia bacterium]
MRNLLLTISFDGTAYHGWQVQENAVTVQQTVQDALEHICSKRDNIVGCSRTDAGVHANMYCCNIRTDSAIDCKKLVGALNAVLPKDIAALDCKEVDFEFHARYDCKSKEYIYKIWNSPNKNPFLYNYSLHYKYPLDEKFLSEQAKAFMGTHHFDSFCAAGSSVEDTERTVVNACVEREGDMVIFRVEADGFLYNMVRIMVGTLIDISRGRIPPDSIESIISAKNRSAAGYTAPAHGLYLNKIHY